MGVSQIARPGEGRIRWLQGAARRLPKKRNHAHALEAHARGTNLRSDRAGLVAAALAGFQGIQRARLSGLLDALVRREVAHAEVPLGGWDAVALTVAVAVVAADVAAAFAFCVHGVKALCGQGCDELLIGWNDVAHCLLTSCGAPAPMLARARKLATVYVPVNRVLPAGLSTRPFTPRTRGRDDRC